MVPQILIAYMVPLFLGLILLEVFIYKRTKRNFPWAEVWVTQVIGLAYVLFNKLISPYLAMVNNYAFEHRFLTMPVDGFWGICLLFLTVEFFYYWQHRWAHEIRWMWANHSTHHTPVFMTLSGAYRLGVTSVFSGAFLFFIPIFLMGFPVQSVAMMFGIVLFYQFFIHTECLPKLGWLEYILNTPSHHRVHHATNVEYIDKNYGGILIVFDRIFGTFAAEQAEIPIVYGLIGKEPSLNPITLNIQEWVAIARDIRGAKTWKERFLFAFGRPDSRLRAALSADEAGARLANARYREPPRKTSSF